MKKKPKTQSSHKHHENNAEKNQESFKFHLQLGDPAAAVHEGTLLPAVVP